MVAGFTPIECGAPSGISPVPARNPAGIARGIRPKDLSPMTLSSAELDARTDALRGMLSEQGKRVRKLTSGALDAFFTADA